MTKKNIHCCEKMDYVLNDGRVHIGYVPKHRQYYIDMRNEPAIIYQIYCCPWCGKELPRNLRNEWFNILEQEYGITDPWDNDREKLIPEEFQTDDWWKKRKL